MTTLAAAIAAATIPASSAFAATDGSASATPEYPSSFIRTLDLSTDGLTDYAVNGDTYAFAVKTTIYLLYTDASGDRKLDFKDIGIQITALDYAESKLYYKSASGTYVYPDSATPTGHTFPAETFRVDIDNDLYLLNSSTTELKLFRENGNEELIGEGYSSLKTFGNAAYAVKNGCPCAIEGLTATPFNLDYTDFSAADGIPTETIKDELKTGFYAVKTATLKDGSYYTQIDADDIGGNFKQIRTFKADGAISCLVLFAGKEGTDEVSVIVAGGNCYVTATSSLQPIAYTPPANDWAQGSDGQRKAYIRERAGVYSAPFMCNGTLITKVTAEQAVPVTVQEKFALDFIDASAVFYRVSFTDTDGKRVNGFVSAGFLDEYDYSADENEPKPSGTDGFSYETNVTTVILVLVVVGLVIIAIVYLTIVGTKPDASANKKRKKRQDEE